MDSNFRSYIVKFRENSLLTPIFLPDTRRIFI